MGRAFVGTAACFPSLARGSDGWLLAIYLGMPRLGAWGLGRIARSREIVSAVRWGLAVGMSSQINNQAARAIIERMRERR